MPLLLHGDGQHTRRYLYAGDAAEAFDTILHKGEIGQIYNVDSKDEVSNMQLAENLLGLFGLTDKATWIQHTHDRKFNDRRYAVDGSKLRRLGWEQRTKFEDALRATVDWYGKFEGWFGDIEGVLTAHPVVQGDHVVPSAVTASLAKMSKVQAGLEVHAGAAVDEEYACAIDGVLVKVEEHANGKDGNGVPPPAVKKRKADEMSHE